MTVRGMLTGLVPARPFLRDRHVRLALLAGPLCWLALVALGLPRPPGSPPAALLFAGILVYPLLEEIVFRGGLQGALLARPPLARRIAGISLANVLTSCAFAAAHLWSQPPIWAAAVIPPSLVFGHLRERFDHILPGFLLHAFYNAGFLILFAASA